MKICILSVDFPPNIGGIAAHVFELSKELVKKGNEVHVITFRTNLKVPNKEVIDGITIYRVYKPFKNLFGLLLYSFFAFIKLREVLKNNNIDVIHYHNIIPDSFISKYINGVPKIQTEHSSVFLNSLEKGNKITFIINKWLIQQADHIIGPSVELKDSFLKFKVPDNKLSFISNGVDIKKFNPFINGNHVKKKYKIDENVKIILCPRRLVPKNGVIYLIESLPLILNKKDLIKVLIVGSGPELRKLEKKAYELKVEDQIIFAGEIPNLEMPYYYAAADIVVLPSLKEATSISGLEAMASGKALVGTNIGGIPYLINENETGMLVNPKNSQELARAIIDLLKSGKTIKMGLKGREKVEKEFSWDIITKKTIKIYENLIKNNINE